MSNQNSSYLSIILLRGIIAMRNNTSDEKANELTDNLLTKSDWHRLFDDIEDAVNQSDVDYDLIEKQLIHFLNMDEYWIEWANRVNNKHF